MLQHAMIVPGSVSVCASPAVLATQGEPVWQAKEKNQGEMAMEAQRTAFLDKKKYAEDLLGMYLDTYMYIMLASHCRALRHRPRQINAPRRY